MTAPADGGAAPAAAAPTPNDAAAAAAKAPAPADPGQGFPADTPLEQMTEAQRTAYWRHYARKHEATVKGFKGATPDDVDGYRARIEELETERLSAGEQAAKATAKQAADEAASAARKELLPQIQQLEVKSIASGILSREQLAAFMAIADPAKLVGDDGHADEEKVMGHLTAMFGTAGRTGSPAPQQPRWQNAGQFSPPAPGPAPGAAGRAEAQRRSGKTTK